MRKTFLSNIALLISLNLLIKVFWIFGIDRTVQNTVGAIDYGLYFAVFNFSFLFSVIMDAGIHNFNNRTIAQNQKVLAKYLSHGLALKMMLSGVYIVFSLLVALIIGYDAYHFKLLGLLILMQILISFLLYLRSNLSALFLFKTDSVISVMDRSISIIICSILLWGGITKQAFQIEWFIYAQLVAYFITTLIALWVIIQKSGLKKLSWHFPFKLAMLKKAFPYALLSLLMTIYGRSDSVLIERLLPEIAGSEQAGIYASAYRLIDSINMIPALFVVILLPMFAKMIKQKENFMPVFKLSFTLLITLSLLFSVFSYFYAAEIIQVLYYQHVAESTLIYKYLVFTFIPISIIWTFGTLLTANGSLKVLNMIAFAGVVANLLINMILIPRFEAMGAVVASIVTQSITALLQIILTCKIFNLKISIHTGIQYLILIVGIILATIGCKYYAVDWWWAIVCIGMFTIMLLFVSGLIKVKDVFLFLKNDKDE